MHGVAVRPGHPGGARRDRRHAGAGRARLPGVGVAHLRHLRGADAGRAGGRRADAARPPARARLARKLASAIGMDDWVRVRLGRVGGDARRLAAPRGAGVLTSLVRADGLLVVPAGRRGPPRRRGGRGRAAARRSTQIERTIVAIGSHDMMLDLAASALRASDPGVDARVGQRRIDGRADRAARRAVPPGGFAPARPGDRASTRSPTSTGCWRRPTSRSSASSTASRGCSSRPAIRWR